VLIVVGSSLVLALSTAWSVGNADEFGAVMTAGLDYLPAELVLGGLALALFGLWPRGFGFIWAAYAAATFIAFLGPGLKLARWVLDLALTTHVGNPPVGTADAGNLAALVIVASTLVPVGFIAFHRRGRSPTSSAAVGRKPWRGCRAAARGRTTRRRPGVVGIETAFVLVDIPARF
jgi:ABC-2 type transport system permease protein